MTAADLRRAIALCRAAGHTTVPVPIRVLRQMLAQMPRQSRGLAPPETELEPPATLVARPQR